MASYAKPSCELWKTIVEDKSNFWKTGKPLVFEWLYLKESIPLAQNGGKCDDTNEDLAEELNLQ